MITARHELAQLAENILTDQKADLLLTILGWMDVSRKKEWTLKDFAVAVGKARTESNCIIRCGTCPNWIAGGIPAAAEAGWSPDSWLSETEPGPAPICPECQVKYFDYGCGELLLRSPGEIVG